MTTRDVIEALQLQDPTGQRPCYVEVVDRHFHGHPHCISQIYEDAGWVQIVAGISLAEMAGRDINE